MGLHSEDCDFHLDEYDWDCTCGLIEDPKAARPAWLVIPDGAWYVVSTNPRCEGRAAASLHEAGLEAFLPNLTRWARHGRQKYKATTPLFLRYLFVFVPGEEGKRNFHDVRGCDGVERILGNLGKPIPIPTRSIRWMRKWQQQGEWDATISHAIERPFGEGQAIKVRLGKFADWPGRVLNMTEEGRVKVLLSMFGKEHTKELAVEELEAA